LLCGDSTNAEDVARVCDGKVQGVFTSPPYAEQRKNQYGGIPVDEYVQWWEIIQSNMRGVLKEDGSFFINIKEHSEEIVRPTYVHELVVAHVQQWGWFYLEQYCWERTGVPCDPSKMGKFKNQWEPVFLFSLVNRPKFNPNNVMHDSDSVPIYKEIRQTVGKYQGSGECVIGNDRVLGKGRAYPGNRIKANRNEALGHPGAFPSDLPEFFIKAYSEEQDTWFDPFLGSGTVLIACEQTGRRGRGIEICEKYCAVTLERLAQMGLEPVRAETYV